MRLLQCLPNGVIALTENLRDDAVPPYAILSHTWGDEHEEVTYDDMICDAGQGKVGYAKIQFCAEQAAEDGLQHFWVDSCCINKLNRAELQIAISSMFRWYKRAQKCYVYLPDVSVNEIQLTWKQAFKESRWFTRGWTLQELLAPSSVEFFSREAHRLGDKRSLERLIHEITGIPQSALQGENISSFSVNQRMSWIEIRQTKIEEDRAYSLLGIFGVDLPLRYGEGQVSAFARLEKEIDELGRCLRHLRLNDPYHHKKRIEHVKGGLLEDSYRWILGNPDFQTWRTDEQSRLLWIKGDPGKGKTMLLCGIINELSKPMIETSLLAYFFCESTDSRINTATAVLRGLIYMLVCQQPSLVSHIRTRYDHAGKALFEDSDAWFALSDIFTNILEDSSLTNCYLVVDALDECASADLPKLLEFIVEKSSLSSCVKWLVSSRNWPAIEDRMKDAESKVKLSLELNAESVSLAVDSYVRYKVQRLVRAGSYDHQTHIAIVDHLLSNADNTFLWVALVCENLTGTPQGMVRARLESFPPGLGSLYGRMIVQISETKDSSLCKRVLALIATVFEPISLYGLASLVELLEGSLDDTHSILQVVNFCGSFLVVRDNMIHFVHQSAKDYLLTDASMHIFPSGREEIHHNIFSRSLEVLSQRLQRNMYNLDSLGCSIEHAWPLEPDPLAALHYACLYWVDHLCESNLQNDGTRQLSLQQRGVVDAFLREKYLYWLEAMSLCKRLPKAVLMMTDLENLVQGGDGDMISKLVHDARRFVMYHKRAIEVSPLQAYVSALIFSPGDSLIKRHFKEEEPCWVSIKPSVEAQWSACLQTLEGHTENTKTVAFSHDSSLIASGSGDETIRIWSVESGECLRTLTGHTSWINSVVFSHNSTLIASASNDYEIKIWDTLNGRCLQTLDEHDASVASVTFSPDSRQLASGSYDYTIKIWYPNSGICRRTLGYHDSVVFAVIFSPDATQLASASEDRTIKLWNVDKGICLKTLDNLGAPINSLAFSHDWTSIATVQGTHATLTLRNLKDGECMQTLESQDFSKSVAFSGDSSRLASGLSNGMIEIWDTSSGTCLKTLGGHSGSIISIAFSSDSTRLVSGSEDGTVRIWDVSGGFEGKLSDTNLIHHMTAVNLSHDQTRITLASSDGRFRIWDVGSGACLKTLAAQPNVYEAALSHDFTKLALTSEHYGITLWDLKNGTYLMKLNIDQAEKVGFLTFLHDSTLLVALLRDYVVHIWDLSSGNELRLDVSSVKRSGNVASWGVWDDLAHASYHCTAEILHPVTGVHLQKLDLGHIDAVRLLDLAEDTDLHESVQGDGMIRKWDASRGKHGPDTVVNVKISFKSSKNVVGVSPDREWITYNSENLVWLPPEYRPFDKVVVSERMIAVGCDIGKVWWCTIDPDKISC